MRVEGGGAGACRRVGGEGGKVVVSLSRLAHQKGSHFSLSLCFSRKKRQPRKSSCKELVLLKAVSARQARQHCSAS